MNRLASRVAALLLAFTVHGGLAAAEPLQPFTTDGCSLFPDRAPDGSSDWCHCCLAHDLDYWKGGTSAERLEADRAFKACVLRASGDKALARLMFAGVRTGGGPETGAPFRWGYGWPRGRQYTPLSAAERAEAARLELEYRERNPALQCPR